MKRRVRFPLAALVMCFFLTGCGDKLHEMTGDERDLITSYAGYVVAMHNTYQKDGLVSTRILEPETEEAAVQDSESNTDTKDTERTKDSSTTPDAAGKSAEKKAAAASDLPITMAAAFGREKALKISYTGVKLSRSYAQGPGYSVQAPQGKTFIVAGFSIKNTSGKKVTLDNLSRGARFMCRYNGGEAKVTAEVTFLEEDLGTYSETIAPGKRKKGVLLFAVPDNVKKIHDFSMSVVVDNKENLIKL